MNESQRKRRPSEQSRRWTWRITNTLFVALFGALAWWFVANKVLAVIFGVCGVFALINVFVVPKRDRPTENEK